MEQEARNSTEADTALREAYRTLCDVPYNADLHKLARNLSNMADKLSQIEVYVRRTHSRSRYAMQHKKMLKEFNTGITVLKQYLLIARIMA